MRIQDKSGSMGAPWRGGEPHGAQQKRREVVAETARAGASGGISAICAPPLGALSRIRPLEPSQPW